MLLSCCAGRSKHLENQKRCVRSYAPMFPWRPKPFQPTMPNVGQLKSFSDSPRPIWDLIPIKCVPPRPLFVYGPCLRLPICTVPPAWHNLLRLVTAYVLSENKSSRIDSEPYMNVGKKWAPFMSFVSSSSWRKVSLPFPVSILAHYS